MTAPARTVQPADYMTDDNLRPLVIFESNAARPVDYNDWYRLSFYNIGWNVMSKKANHTMDGLATEICNMAHCKCVP